MKRLVLCCVLSGLPVLLSAQTEIGVAGGVSEGTQMGQRGTVATAAVNTKAAIQFFDIELGASYAGVQKIGEPDGYQVSQSVGVRHWFGSSVYMRVGTSRTVTDVHTWTKTVYFGNASAGVCARYRLWPTKRPVRMLVSVGYEREFATDAVAPNKTNGITFDWSGDVPLHRNLFLRVGLGASWPHYLQSDEWRSGTTSKFSLGLVHRKLDH